MDIFGRCTAHLVCFELYLAHIMYSRWKTQTVGGSSIETRLKAVDSTYCVRRNILTFTGFSSTARTVNL